jgi:hypothetical protein
VPIKDPGKRRAYFRDLMRKRRSGAPSIKDALADTEKEITALKAQLDEAAILIELRKEIELLRKRTNEFENFLPLYETWLCEADRIIKARNAVMKRKEWATLISWVHSDTRTEETLNRATQMLLEMKHVLCDERQLPTIKPRAPGYEWEARRRSAQQATNGNLDRTRQEPVWAS